MELESTSNKRQLISLTPLIDVVFILLVFFMLASSFAKWQFIELSIGEADSIKINNDIQSLITVDANQQYQLNGKAMDLDMIVSVIETRIQAKSDHPVLIKPTDDLALQELMIVLETIGRVAGPNLSLVDQEN